MRGEVCSNRGIRLRQESAARGPRLRVSLGCRASPACLQADAGSAGGAHWHPLAISTAILARGPNSAAMCCMAAAFSSMPASEPPLRASWTSQRRPPTTVAPYVITMHGCRTSLHSSIRFVCSAHSARSKAACSGSDRAARSEPTPSDRVRSKGMGPAARRDAASGSFPGATSGARCANGPLTSISRASAALADTDRLFGSPSSPSEMRSGPEYQLNARPGSALQELVRLAHGRAPRAAAAAATGSVGRRGELAALPPDAAWQATSGPADDAPGCSRGSEVRRSGAVSLRAGTTSGLAAAAGSSQLPSSRSSPCREPEGTLSCGAAAWSARSAAKDEVRNIPAAECLDERGVLPRLRSLLPVKRCGPSGPGEEPRLDEDATSPSRREVASAHCVKWEDRRDRPLCRRPDSPRRTEPLLLWRGAQSGWQR